MKNTLLAALAVAIAAAHAHPPDAKPTWEPNELMIPPEGGTTYLPEKRRFQRR